MPYQVLARKYRPHSFPEIVGQEHILRMLINALNNQRLHHAYLFTGTRGVGKTTLGRLLAKCLNCETGITATPCNQCNTCHAIDAGNFLDLIEVDAASRTKVEDTRELLENVQYAPTQGRFKIYLIDEVHMLSGHSFNALLKTLEEPPAHVKFILATTDPKRLPVTILSRCLQFHLKRVPPELITKQLQHICDAEKVSYDNPALAMVADAADGSMRDALSLLDQTIAYCRENITLEDTRALLGNIEHAVIFRLIDALIQQDGKQLLDEIARLSESAPDFNHVLETFLVILHRIAVAQIVGEETTTTPEIKQFAKQLTAEDIQLYYQIALMGKRDLPLAPHPLHGFEMIMLRMLAFHFDEKPVESTPPPIQQKNNITPKQSVNVSTPTPVAKGPMQPTASQDWSVILSKLGLSGLALALATNCSLKNITDRSIELALSVSHKPMLNQKLSDRIEQALQQYFNKPMQLMIHIADGELDTPHKQQIEARTQQLSSATENLKNDTQVKKIMDVFGATLDVDSVKTI